MKVKLFFSRIISLLLAFLDRLAAEWLYLRQEWRINHDPEFIQFRKDFEKDASIRMDGRGIDFLIKNDHLVTLIEDFAGLLDAVDAKNYFSFDMIPRLDRDMKPIRVTIQWADGMSPAMKAAKLEKELKILQEKLDWESTRNEMPDECDTVLLMVNNEVTWAYWQRESEGDWENGYKHYPQWYCISQDEDHYEPVGEWPEWWMPLPAAKVSEEKSEAHP